MRKFLIFTLALGLFAACNNNKDKDRRDDRRSTRESDDYRDRDSRDRNDDRNTDYDDRDRNNDRNVSNNDDNGNSGGGWSSREVETFVNECVSEAEKSEMGRSMAVSYCECMQKQLERMYPDPNDVADIDMESAKMQQMAKDCLGIKD